MTTSSAILPARALTRVVIENVAEVVIAERDGVARRWIRRQQQSAILGRRGAAKRIGGTGDERAALLPDTLATRDSGGEDRVEGRANRRVHAPRAGVGISRIGDVALARWIRRVLDTWQIGLERDLPVVEEPAGSQPGEQRAAEHDGRGVHRRVSDGIGIGARPVVRVLGAVKVGIGARTPGQRPERRSHSGGRGEAPTVIGIYAIRIRGAGRSAAATGLRGAILEVTDLV